MLQEESFQLTTVCSSNFRFARQWSSDRPLPCSAEQAARMGPSKLGAVRESDSHDGGFEFGCGSLTTSLTRTMTSSGLAWG